MVEEGCSHIEGSFMWAVWHMRKGLKVRRWCWETGLHILINEDIKIPHWNLPNTYVTYDVPLRCLEAMDWKLYTELNMEELYKLKSEFVQKEIYQPNTIKLHKDAVKIINIGNADTLLGMKIVVDDSIDPTTAIISYEDRRNLSDRIDNAINAAIFERQYKNKQTVCKDEDNRVLKVEDVKNSVQKLISKVKNTFIGDTDEDWELEGKEFLSFINKEFGDALVLTDESGGKK